MSVRTILNKPPGYAGVGRPCKLTPELQTKICDLIRKGNYIITSCQACGIDKTTYTSWLEKGQAELDNKTPGPFSSFLTAAKEAEAIAEVQLVADVKLHTNRNVVAPLAMLDRRFRERWGQTPAINAVGGNTYINMEKVIIDASDKFKAALARIADRAVDPVVIPEGTVTPAKGAENADAVIPSVIPNEGGNDNATE